MSSLPTECTSSIEPLLCEKELGLTGGIQTAKLFNTMRKSVFRGLGAQFWGIRINSLGEVTSHRPDSMMYRWSDITLLLQKIPEKGDETEKSLKLNYFDAIKHAERNMDSEVFDTLEIVPVSLGLTYGEAFHTPNIRFPAIKALQENGDPFIGTICALEEWRLANYEIVTDRQSELGRETFEKFLFAYGDDNLIPTLGAAAIGYLK